jgi:hypothetical protein
VARYPARKWQIGTDLMLYALILLGALWARRWIVGGLDLRDHAGAAGPITLSRAALGEFHRSLDVWLIGEVMTWTGDDPMVAAQVISLGSSMAMVLGALMGGWAMAGRRGALGAGLVTAAWSLSIYPAVVIGADPPAYGLIWLAAGLTWLGARLGWRGLPLLAAGCVMAGFATAIKESALPGVVVAAMAPLVIRKRYFFLIPCGLVTYLALQWGWETFEPRQKFIFDQIPPVTLQSFQHGWIEVGLLPQRHMAAGVFDDLTVLCLLGALLPGPAWKQRAAMGLGALGCLWLCARTIDVATRAPVVPRRLIGVSFGVVVMAGVGLGMIQHSLRRWRWLSWLPMVGISGMFFLDSWAYFYAWGQQRLSIAGGEAPTFAEAPEAWSRRYGTMTDMDFRDLSAYGSLEFVELVEAHPGGVALPRLRDERHAHLAAAAELADIPWVILDPIPCGNKSAGQVLQAVSDAGMLVVIPTHLPGINRVNGENLVWEGRMDCRKPPDPTGKQPYDYCWVLQLEAAAETRGGLAEAGPFWKTLAPTGSGAELPCQGDNPTHRGDYDSTVPGFMK